jgi:precorrin-6B methylase 2
LPHENCRRPAAGIGAFGVIQNATEMYLMGLSLTGRVPAIDALRNLTAALAMLTASATGLAAQTSPRLDVIFVPTPTQVVERMLDLAEVRKGEFLIDLGCGDGRIPVTAAKKYGARGLGVDLDPQRIKEANANVAHEKVGDMVEIRQQNLFETDLSKADVISMYLLTDLNLKLRPKLLDLKPGTRLVSHAFSMGEWMPERKETLSPRYDVYLWIVPAKVAGRWTVKRGEKEFTVELTQKYQTFEGTARIDGKAVPVRNGRLLGKEIIFDVDVPRQTGTFRGTVEGDTIDGFAGWSAKKSG